LQLFEKLVFGRQPPPDDIFTALDQAAKLIGNLAIKASCFHSLERHARLSLNDPGWIGSFCLLGLGWLAVAENWPYQLTKD
jgi:hypothetical protein